MEKVTENMRILFFIFIIKKSYILATTVDLINPMKIPSSDESTWINVQANTKRLQIVQKQEGEVILEITSTK